MEENKKVANIDEETKQALAEQIELGISTEEEMRRVELNFFSEFFGVLRDVNTAMRELQQVVGILSADKLNAYFKEISDNAHKVEVERKLKEKISMSHKKSTKKVGKR